MKNKLKILMDAIAGMRPIAVVAARAKVAMGIMTTLMIAVVAATSLSGCAKLWEDEQHEHIPLPETEIPITPEPWETPVTESEEI